MEKNIEEGHGSQCKCNRYKDILPYFVSEKAANRVVVAVEQPAEHAQYKMLDLL